MFDRTVYELSRRDLVRSKKALFALLVSVIPFLLIGITLLEESSGIDVSYQPVTSAGLVFLGLTATIPLACLLLAGGSIADEAEERTLSYLLVRPISRSTLFWSRTAAVMTVAVALAAFQVASVWIVDAMGVMAMGGDSRVPLQAGGTASPWTVLVLALPIGLFVAALAAVFYTTMFSAVSVLFTRYHFFANLLWFGVWELAIGWSHLPIAWLSGNHALRVLTAAMDRTVENGSPLDAGPLGLIGLPVVALMCVVWAVLGIQVMQRRDFHITSAAT